MPALNAERFITEALDSVATQDGGTDDIEVIVADGGSNDHTRQIAARYSFVRVLDGVDNGIYEGFNRGLAAAHGNIVGFLNTDDLLAKGALNIVHDRFDQHDSPDYISGAVTQGNPPATENPQCHAAPMSVPGLLFGIPVINGRFFRRSLIVNLDGFKPEAGMAADREILLRVLKSGASGSNVERTLYHYRVHSGSATIAGDGASRARVWQAELQLANYLERQNVLTKGEKKWISRTRALADIKQRFATNRVSANAVGHHGGSFLLSALPHMVQALIAWRYWRRKLSGY